MDGLDTAANGDDGEGAGEGEQELAQGVVREQRGDEDADADRAEAPEEVDDGERGAGAFFVAAAGEDVGGGDDLAESDAGDEQGDGSGDEAAGVGEAGEAGAGGEQAEKDAVAQAIGDGGTADEGAEMNLAKSRRPAW